MFTIIGTYQNGFVKLDRDIASDNPIKVIVTFLSDIQTLSDKRISLSDFSFSKSQKNLENYKGSFRDTVVEERRNY